MPDFRHNPLTNRWVIIAEGRTGRPNEFEQHDLRKSPDKCPFCLGNESETPSALAVSPASHNGSGDGNWEVRVFPNKFPALTPQSAIDRPQNEDVEHGPYRSQQAIGHHEIIVESPEHISSLTEVTDRQLELSFQVYRDRIRNLANTPGIQHAMLFKNCRPEAGASIHHVHSQLIGTPIIPADVASRVAQAKSYYSANGKSLFQAMLEFELKDGQRIVSETPRFVAFCPYSSRVPYEVWIFQKPPSSEFIEFDDSRLAEAGRLVRGVLRQLEQVLNKPAYNSLFHMPPFDSSTKDYYQWHMELFPRLTKTAGYEWGTGCMINQVAPENAARQLRFNDC